MFPVSEFSKSKESFAICVGRTDSVLTHSGFLYSVGESPEESNCYFLHLGGPIHLTNDSEFATVSSKGYVYEFGHYVWLPILCDEEQKNLLTSKCILISKQNRNLPYSILHDENTTFDAKGVLKLGVNSFGLTCSSFVKTVLKSQNINIIDESDWPDERPDDLEWAEHMLTVYDKSINSFDEGIKVLTAKEKDPKENKLIIQSTIQKLKGYRDLMIKARKRIDIDKEVCFRRYRPEEVASAANLEFKDMPIKYEYFDKSRVGAGELGLNLREKLPTFPVI